jgi:alpha 1,6-mannosyltransferase
VRELVKAGNETSALKLTGPGPYTDAVLRYLLVRYGVRPQQLRNIYQPVRVGDVL